MSYIKDFVQSWVTTFLFMLTIVLACISLFLLSQLAHAGTCVNRQDGSAAVMSCSNGSVTVYHRSGRVEQWGYRNGGFDRYPGYYYPPRRLRHGE